MGSYAPPPRLRPSSIPNGARSPSINLGSSSPFYQRPAPSSAFSVTSLVDAYSSLSSRAKRALVGSLLVLFFFGGGWIRRSGDSGVHVRQWRDDVVSTRVAKDGTPRASLFRPAQGATSNAPSVSFSRFLDSQCVHFLCLSLPQHAQELHAHRLSL
jgi:hypothetical protein